MKIAVIGSNGQLGSDICVALRAKHEVVAFTHEDIEVTDMDSVRTVLRGCSPRVVINTSAFHVVPTCESDPGKAFLINTTGAMNLAKVTQELESVVVHFSTDYVFDGQKGAPYIESDRESPLNVYGLSKLAGERAVAAYNERHFVIRVSGLYGSTPCRAKGTNFIATMLRMSKEKPIVTVVRDEILSPTCTEDIAGNLALLLDSEAFGLYHMVSAGQCSWYDFAKVIFETLRIQTPLKDCSVADFPSSVRRPSYSALDNKALATIRLDHMPDWKEALERYLRRTIQ